MTIKKPLGHAGSAVAALRVGLTALLMGLFTLIAAVPAAYAASAPDPATVVASWKNSKDHFYEMSGSPLSSSQQDEVRKAIKDSKAPIYVAALPDGTVTTAQVSSYIPQLLTELDKAGRSKATVAVLDGTTLFAGSNDLPKNAAGTLAKLSTNANNDLVTGMQDFVNRVNLVKDGDVKGARDRGTTVGGGGGGSGVLVGILGIAVVGGAGLWIIGRRKKRKREEREAAELAAVKQTVEEDVTKFGEEITALDLDMKMLPQAETTTDWQRALDSYERAKNELAAVQRADELRTVTSTLEDGRYALACVKARVNNQPPPERLPPCFFNPQHGPSVRNVRWAPPGGAVRDVPACAADAEAVERGFDPQMREVMVNGERRPYWDAGPAYQPYAYGYYGGFGGDLLTGMMVGTMLGHAFGGWGHGGYGAGYDSGYAAGVESGGGDWGGGDFGGGGFGGGDWGGGSDFGGGDFGGGDW
ncbi:hypothetical protein ACFHYQ_21570 [Sphaerimonospora cavernae]|uniref:TPM domain-containing protein n=1 Tax=Sphaerimonospora cavernae TaxID=1740611 RepID=A0ABV6U9P9_9ACTN